MRTRLAYDGPEGEPFEVPDGDLAGVLAPRDGDNLDEDALLDEAMRAPLGTPALAEMARGAGRVLLVVDDATRRTPVPRVLERVAPELARAGVDDARVTVVTAQGTHRRMTDAEVAAKLGRFAGRWRVEQHDWLDRERLVSYGETRRGMPVVASRLLAEHDLRVGVGSVGVHGIMGFSGGAKIVLPGLAGPETEAGTHWTASHLPQAETMGVLETPLRHEIEEGARLAGLDAVVNLAMDRRGRVQRAAFGDPVEAQRACARVARDLFAAPLDAPADVAVVEARPADLDYWQSIKGLYAGTLCVRDGGVIILVAPNPEGVARNHPNVLGLAGLPLEEIRARVEGGRVEDVVGAAVAAYTARIRARSDVLLVSSGVTRDEARRLGFTKARTAQEALEEARRRVGRHARTLVARHGGGVLPVVEGVNARHVREGRAARELPDARLRAGLGRG